MNEEDDDETEVEDEDCNEPHLKDGNDVMMKLRTKMTILRQEIAASFTSEPCSPFALLQQ